MKLVDNWREAKKWFSMWAMGVPAATGAAWMMMPQAWQDYLLANVPPKFIVPVFVGVLALGMAGRLIDQAAKK